VSNLPTGTVTFLFTDIEGSTRLIQHLGDSRSEQVFGDHRRLLREAVEASGGLVYQDQGESFLFVFQSARDAVAAAIEIQRALARHPWPAGGALLVRMGLHSGEPAVTPEGYVGVDVHRVARICQAAHGGQILVTETTREIIADDLPEGVTLRDLGEHRLRDLLRPQRLFQLGAADIATEFPPLRSLELRLDNLPRQLSSFIGREREIAEVRRLLTATPLLTLTGSGGVGKTRLALQVGAQVRDKYSDGVWFAELGPLSDSALIGQTIASALGVRDQPGRQILSVIIDFLQPKTLLLILDNAEHVLNACAETARALLLKCPRLRLLVTSRERLGVAGETTWRVPSLSLPDPRALPSSNGLANYESVRLFTERAKALVPTFALTHHQATWVAQICHRLDGIPLAIELAAARIAVLSPEHIARRLDERFDLLTAGSRTALRRQQTLRATIDWSYELLSQQERALLCRLSVFAGGLTLEAAEAVCAGGGIDGSEIVDLLSRLIDKSLVVLEEQQGAPRYRLLETVRRYGRDRLDEEGKTREIARRHRDFFLILARRAEQALRGSDQAVWMACLEAERENMRAALEWSLKGRDAAAALRLVGKLWPFWYGRGYSSEGREWIRAALSASDATLTPARAEALNGAAFLAWRQGDFGQAETLGEQSLAAYRELGQQSGIAYASIVLGHVARERRDYERAMRLYEESLTLFRESADSWGIALSLANLGFAAFLRGDYARATALSEESLTLFRMIGEKFGIGFSLYTLSLVALRQGDYPRAAALAEQSLAVSREHGEREGMAYTQQTLGVIARHEGRHDDAAALFEESLGLFRELGDKRGIADSLNNLAVVADRRGSHERAAAFYRECLAVRIELGDTRGIAACFEGLANIASALGQYARAARLVGAAQPLRGAVPTQRVSARHAELDRTVAAARTALGEDTFAAAVAEGQAMRFEQAVEYARKNNG